jgi:DMSO/TMAO reductase YedYZ molybdopterin-dependent catalytic subunit
MMQRRNLLAAFGAAFLSGCSKIGDSKVFGALVDGAEGWHRGIHRALGMGRITMAPEYTRADVSPDFRGNGNVSVDSTAWRALAAGGFADWRLEVSGLVDTPLSLSLADLGALPQRTQITRHDCVEGWSAIGEWTGPQLSAVLALAGIQPEARYTVFRCADSFRQGAYYESCDMDDAMHPQTILAHALNGEPLPEKNGAPLRLRIERQLGYKHAKYLVGIELVASLDDVGLGKGGYWEDHHGYQWYAGI